MPRATVTAACDKCGESFNKWPKNRKFCAACQAMRDLEYRPGMHKKCVHCEKEFWPSRTSHDACADCMVFAIENEDKYPECPYCGKHKRTAPGAPKVCISCIQSSKDMQDKYYRTLKNRWGKIQRAREAA